MLKIITLMATLFLASSVLAEGAQETPSPDGGAYPEMPEPKKKSSKVDKDQTQESKVSDEDDK